jgi:hypothetical protein
MEYYLSTTVGNKLIKSPFRKDEKPTCGFYYGKKTGRLYLHDFGNEEHYDAIAVVMKKFNIDYTSAINKVLEDGSKIAMLDSSKKDGAAKELSWIPTDNVHPYFSRFKIPPEYLPFYGVYAAKAIYADEVLWGRATATNPIFVYTQPSGRIRTYRPLTKKREDKWYGNISAYDVYGLYQLPPSGQTLIITSSLKDVMVLKVLGFNAIAFSGEGYGAGKEGSESRRVVAKVLEKLSPRFKHIIFFMDNDDPGLQYNEKLSSIYRLPNIAIPKGYPKDISDCIYRYGTNKARRIMKKLLSKKFNQNHYESSDEYLGYLNSYSPNGDLGRTIQTVLLPVDTTGNG